MLLLSFSLVTVILALNENIKGIVNLSPIQYAGGDRFDIPCASSEYSKNASFSKWGKVWRINQTESFEASRVTFINDNATLRISSPQKSDSGFYECCVHVYAYEDFLCFASEILIPAGVIQNATTSSSQAGKNQTAPEPPLPPAWNVDLIGSDTLNAIENCTYFIRLFDVNVTDIKCLKDGNGTSSLHTSNKFPSPMFADALLPKFNASLHEGIYFCNGSYKNGNETEILPAEFQIISSADPNHHSELLAAEIVKQYRNSAIPQLFSGFIALLLISIAF